MKKFVAILLAVLMLAGAALAETAVCITDSGVMVTAADCLNALALDADTAAVSEITRMFAVGDDVYFVCSMQTAESSLNDDVFMSEVYENTLYRMSPDGAVEQIGEMQYDYYVYEYADEYSQLGAYTAYNGYGDLTVYGDAIYYIGNDSEPGSYFTEATEWGGEEGPQRFETFYDSGAAVWRMNLDGSDPQMLISGLGNGVAHLAVENDCIAVSSCFINAVFAYDFTNFTLYDLDCNLVAEFPNNTESRHSWLYKEDCEFTVIVDAITTDGNTIYASLSDSEGDFASSHFVDVNDIDETLAIEAFFTPSKLCENGYVFLTSAVQNVFWDEKMMDTVMLHAANTADGSGLFLAYVPEEALGDCDVDLDVIGDMVYLTTDACLLRVPLTGGDVEVWNGDEFVADPAFAPEAMEEHPDDMPQEDDFEEAFEGELEEEFEVEEEIEEEIEEEFEAGTEEEPEEEPQYYLPDSDTRLYTREELSQYDTETLGFMRNEILARHGYPFKKEKYREYFGSRDWYVEDPNFDYNCLSKIEMDNVETIKKIEESR